MNDVFNTISLALEEVIFQKRNLDQVISFWLSKNKKAWTNKNILQFVTILQETTRWWRLLYEINKEKNPKFRSLTQNIVAIYLTRTPFGLPQANRITTKIKKEISKTLESLYCIRAIRESIPDWLDKLGSEELGSRWEKEISYLNSNPPIVLRANRLKTTPHELYKILTNEGYKVKKIANSDALILTKSANVFKSNAFKLGMFEQQDFSSQQVVPFLKVEEGQWVVDACAGNGGKSLHLASLMNNKGKIIALDIKDWKLKELKRRARRAGASNIETKPIETSKTIKRFHKKADRLLIDAPCSGLGVLKRNPDTKWHLTAENIDELHLVQRQILEKYCHMLKPGGFMVYSTYSILPSENEQQVKWFIDKMNGQYTLEEEQTLYPSETGFDGFYMARIKREY